MGDINGLQLVEGGLEKKIEAKERTRKIRADRYRQLFYAYLYGFDEVGDSNPGLAVFYGMRHIGKLVPSVLEYRDALNSNAQCADIRMLLAGLTLAELQVLFPVIKEYDGAKYECKDYFSTMEYLSGRDMETPIGIDGVDDFLWNYYNHDVMMFSVNEMCIIDRLARLSGCKGMLEQFIEDSGLSEQIHTYSIDRENGIAQDNVTGECFEIVQHEEKNPAGDYLRLVDRDGNIVG